MAVDDAVLADLVTAVLRDFSPDIASGWRFSRVVPDREPDADGAVWVCVSSGSDLDGDVRIWFPADEIEPRAHAVLRLADRIQDELVESSAGWGQPLPPCDLHPQHPLQAELVDGAAVWCCPVTHEARRPFAAG